MTGPQDPAAAGRDRLRAGHADREQVIEALKTAFVQGQLTRDELDARAGQALAARTGAELAALTADIPGGPATAGSARPPTPARRRPLARAAAGSGGCLVIAFAAVWVAANILDPNGLGNPYHPWSRLCLLVAFAAVGAALCILGYGVATSVEQRRSRRQLPPRPGPGGHTLEGERHGSAGHGPVPPVPAPARPAPICRPTSRGSTDGTFPPGRAGHPVARGRRPARSDAGEPSTGTSASPVARTGLHILARTRFPTTAHSNGAGQITGRLEAMPGS